MILVRKKYLYILTFLFIVLFIFGEIKYFYALKNISLAANLDIKYEVENFIFIAIISFFVIGAFVIFFTKRSQNVSKKLDKMIELIKYGKQDISKNLEEIGVFGDKIKQLISRLRKLNNMKSVKISSLGKINNFLIERSDKALIALDRYGNISNCSDRFMSIVKVDKNEIINQNITDFFKDINPGVLFFDLDKAHKPILKNNLSVKIRGEEEKHDATFYPVFNVHDEISNIIGIVM